jgi:hypothetical protein
MKGYLQLLILVIGEAMNGGAAIQPVAATRRSSTAVPSAELIGVIGTRAMVDGNRRSFLLWGRSVTGSSLGWFWKGGDDRRRTRVDETFSLIFNGDMSSFRWSSGAENDSNICDTWSMSSVCGR